jgi:hypothetical protein
VRAKRLGEGLGIGGLLDLEGVEARPRHEQELAAERVIRGPDFALEAVALAQAPARLPACLREYQGKTILTPHSWRKACLVPRASQNARHPARRKRGRPCRFNG